MPRSHLVELNDYTVYIITDHISGVSLHAWWIFEVYDSPDIQGVLMDNLCQGMRGPFSTLDEAEMMLQTLYLPSDLYIIKDVNYVDSTSG